MTGQFWLRVSHEVPSSEGLRLEERPSWPSHTPVKSVLPAGGGLSSWAPPWGPWSVSSSRKSGLREQGGHFTALHALALGIPSATFCWSRRPALTQCGRAQHKGTGAILEAVFQGQLELIRHPLSCLLISTSLVNCINGCA